MTIWAVNLRVHFFCLLATSGGWHVARVPADEVARESHPAAPQLTDPRLSLTLFAEDPGIVTPIGMAIDATERVFVIESHTHSPPKDYAGPKHDRIKVFVDSDGDGRADKIRIFAEGLSQAMNLAFSPTGDLFVVCAREVIRLRDTNRDGVADERTRILRLETEERYAHNSLLGLTFHRDGRLFVSRGNTGSRYYRLVGTDGSCVEGYGDGGSIVSCSGDGQHVREFATGFWNGFDLKFDRCGHLLLVDNDPDARGPNRLVHVVEGGDYGYKSMYGGGGNHPFQGWDGSLPGTLPFVIGTGEAPSGLIDLRQSSFPADFSGSILASIWNENSIERYELTQRNHQLSATKSVFMSGSKDFRPVALACDARGNLFVSDWVLVDYPNHGRGRIWRVSNHANEPRLSPEHYFDPYHTSGLDLELSNEAESDRALEVRLRHASPFVRHAAVRELALEENTSVRNALAVAAEPQLRLAALLAMRQSLPLQIPALHGFLVDPSAEVRRAALVWAGESLDIRLRPDLDGALSISPVNAVLFETWYAARENLQPKFIEAVRRRAASHSKSIPHDSEQAALAGVVRNAALPEQVRALAVKRLGDDAATAESKLLFQSIHGANNVLAPACIDRLSRLPALQQGPELAEELVAIVRDGSRSIEIRVAALSGLGRLRQPNWSAVAEAMWDANENVALAAIYALRSRAGEPEVVAVLESAVGRANSQVADSPLPESVQEQLLYALHGPASDKNRFASLRPPNLEGWKAVAAQPGNPFRGRLVFESDRVGCSKCHSTDGRGALLGPDLSRVASSKSRGQIIEAILEPSADFSPQYQAWLVIDGSGQIHRGIQLDHKAAGAIEMLTENGEVTRFEGDDVEAYAASPNSLMPSGLQETMTGSEFRDLVEFLSESR